MSRSQRQAAYFGLVLLAGVMFPAAAEAAPSKRDYSGPANPPEAPLPPEGEVKVNPPADTPRPSEPPPPRQTGPVHPPEPSPPAVDPGPTLPPGAPPPGRTAPAPVEPPAEEPGQPTAPDDAAVEDLGADDGFDGFEVVDLTEDPEALKEELEVESKKVRGAAGTVTGQVKDSVTGEAVIGAYVEAIGTGYRTKTDFDGNYRLELPPGQYEIRIRYDTSEPRRITGVVVAANESQTINSELRPLAGAGQVVKVEAEMNRESEGARMLQRREAVAARDILSRDSIQKSGGGSTASVAVRIVGATVIDGKYLFVRGLGHRYGNTLLDGARVPSPEPDIRTVPLDIFPSGALSAINVKKTCTPDVPGDFAGGSVQLESREIPDDLVFNVSVNAGYNTQTTFRGILHEGGFSRYDAFGFGNIPRALPSEIPDHAPANRNALDDEFRPVWTSEDIERFGESLYTDTRVRRGRIAPPNGSGSATLGYGFSPHEGGKLGFLASAGYSNSHQTYRERWRFYSVAEEDGEYVLQPRVRLEGMRTVQNVQWSSVGLIKYEPKKDQRLSLLGFYSRDADDEVRELTGTNSTDHIRTTRIRYVMRSVLMTRLGGEHRIAKAKGLQIDWFGSFAQARRDDPSIRDMVFQRPAPPMEGPYRIHSQGANNMFLDLVDNTESGAVDFTMPFKQWGQLDGKVKVGAWVEGKQREFLVRRFVFQTVSGAEVPSGTGNIVVDRTIGGGDAGSTQPFYVQETTQPYDSYRANQEVYATYGMLELPLVRWMKVSGGARFEANRQNVEPYNQFTGKTDEERTSKVRNNDVLPAAALTFPVRKDMNVRLSGAQTVARSEFRELAPFLFSDFVGGITMQGQPGLKTARIWNADLRWEWFPSAQEVVAASVFYKYFDDPIERTIRPGTSNLVSTFRNAKLAYNVGAELELRKNLEFVWKRLSNFSVGVNLAYVHSRVRLAETCDVREDPECMIEDGLDVSTSRIRPLQGQAPFVTNAYVDYDRKDSGTNLRVLYNGVWSTLAFVGGNNLPDIYLQPIHQLDLVGRQRIYKGLGLTLQVNNLLNWPIRWRQGREEQLNYQYFPGATIMAGVSYEL